MKNKLAYVTLSFLLLFFLGCDTKTKKTDNSATDTLKTNIEVENDIDSIAKAPTTNKLEVPNKEKTSSSISELLQGKWQHIGDKTNYLVFEGNLRKEIAEGMDKWDIETFVLSNKCANESDKDNRIESKEKKYISCLKSDLCWFIVAIDDTNLTLSYMGRGNTLSYKRVQ